MQSRGTLGSTFQKNLTCFICTTHPIRTSLVTVEVEAALHRNKLTTTAEKTEGTNVIHFKVEGMFIEAKPV
jgi:hypothetical protein